MEFEKDILELEKKIVELKEFSEAKNIDLSGEIDKLKNEYNEKMKEIYSELGPWDRVQVARHPKRPYTLDYVEHITTDFVELHGDRLYKDDPAVVAGICKIDGKKVMIIGHQKGREVEEKIHRNFGMANPEGYRKALRLMKMAERFNMPVITLIDTPGAYPGIEAEKHGQGEAIARNLLEMAGLKVPITAIVIGEGGSGGALAFGVADKVYMCENSIYSVISPEGCAAILFKDAAKAPEAAESLRVSADSVLELGIIDGIILEPVGGAHRNYNEMTENVKKQILGAISELEEKSTEELLQDRYDKFRKMGAFSE
ncbi:acetyl-CoA carboxylase carboxyltransferase subunit alpha [Ilyobacter polytropus]|uniref:Acetyl-coenzyme A carboxylase carboxyl transferase subunit alpha n=1 Tax=Ilyobacter polytropus (strain ATCC 51220 / DSM 2926 / LMG 16218 / CuHBu1) TaxID=572544 RepID=E3HB41_ILYPC|nr:acetyl-CoA carboxylase carboxyltransferase subunit alpha [Ilyobacter polytropus]ADO82190.1 acetyl-CoA carboxylase carboxyltransferase subunit alpha [Ilyobacter polytropus DSM 2926]